MKLRLPRQLRSTNLLAVFAAILITVSRGYAEPLPLERAIHLALTHSTGTAIAQADVQHAIASYRELRNAFIPQLLVGSGLGWTYGYPLNIEGSAPALVNVFAQSSVFNPAARQFIGAAKIDERVAELQDKDQRAAVIQDVALTYSALAMWEARLAHLQQDAAAAQRSEQSVSERLQQGVDSAVDLNKAKLASARVRLRQAEARGNADVLRRHLSTLTGLPASSIDLEAATIPALPPLEVAPDLSEKVLASSTTVKIADQRSLAESKRAAGEHSSVWPSLDFSAQYARFSTFNHYAKFFPPGTFQQDNATIGVSIRIPLFNASQRARADAADADALKAKKQAEATRNQVAEDTLKAQRAAQQLAAAREVAQLEYQLAQSSLDAAQTRADSRTGTWHELADARLQAAERYLMFQDADLEYQRARLNLLRASGELEKWALPDSTAPATK